MFTATLSLHTAAATAAAVADIPNMLFANWQVARSAAAMPLQLLRLLAYSIFLGMTGKPATPVEGVNPPPSLITLHTA